MAQEWIGLRELGRRVGRKHRAVQRAIETGRIPASAVRRDARGRIVAIEYYSAALAWADNTDFDQALRTAAPLRTPAVPASAPAVHTSAQAQELDAEEENALLCHGPLQIAFLAWPTLLKRCGVADRILDHVQPAVLDVFRRELLRAGATQEQAAEETDVFARMLADERARPETESDLLERIRAMAAQFAEDERAARAAGE